MNILFFLGFIVGNVFCVIVIYTYVTIRVMRDKKKFELELKRQNKEIVNMVNGFIQADQTLHVLEDQLKDALENEEFERAASIRDQINKIKTK